MSDKVRVQTILGQWFDTTFDEINAGRSCGWVDCTQNGNDVVYSVNFQHVVMYRPA